MARFRVNVCAADFPGEIGLIFWNTSIATRENGLSHRENQLIRNNTLGKRVSCMRGGIVTDVIMAVRATFCLSEDIMVYCQTLIFRVEKRGIKTRKPPCGVAAQSCSNVSIIWIAVGGGGRLDLSAMFP